MSSRLVLSLSVLLDRFPLSVEWETSEPSLGIFGHSGAGKTTVLEALAGLRGDCRGRIEMNGRIWLDTARGVRLPPEQRGVGYVPQETLLFPHRSVLGNLQTGARRAKQSHGRRLLLERVMEVLELTGLGERAVSSLSGGERRRVALGRALCSGPDLLLLDEPLSGLDLPLRARILPYLLRIQEEFALPTIHVTHDATEIALLAREVLVLDSGRVIARGRPGKVLTSRPIFSMAREEGFENLFRGRVVEATGATASVELEPGLRILVPGEGLEAGREAVFGIRAEDLILSVSPPSGLSAQNILPGRIREIREELEGAEGRGAVVVEVALGISGLPVLVAITPQALRQLALENGQKVHLVGKTHACRVLTAR